MSDNRAASRPQPGVLNQPVRLPQRRTLLVVAAAALLAGGAFALWKYVSANPPTWMVRWKVQRYLKKEAHTGNFKVENFVFPTKEEMARKPDNPAGDLTPKGSRTGKDFDALRDEYFTLKTSALALERKLMEPEARTNSAMRGEFAAKEAALAPVVSDLWELQRGLLGSTEGGAPAATFASSRVEFTREMRQKFDKAASYAEMYQLIGQELWVASRLLGSANPEYVRAGISLALSASQHAVNHAQNGWVAARICEGYVLPHLDVANDTNRRSPFNQDNLLSECADIFRRNEEYSGVVRIYKMALAQAGTTEKADSARAQIARAYEQAGDLKQALHYLRSIQDTNDNRWVLRSAQRLEQRLKAN